MTDPIRAEGLTDAYLLGKYDGIKQGRADERAKVIEEFKKLWDERVKDLIGWCRDKRLIGLQQADLIFDEVAEQLKEQK